MNDVISDGAWSRIAQTLSHCSFSTDKSCSLVFMLPQYPLSFGNAAVRLGTARPTTFSTEGHGNPSRTETEKERRASMGILPSGATQTPPNPQDVGEGLLGASVPRARSPWWRRCWRREFSGPPAGPACPWPAQRRWPAAATLVVPAGRQAGCGRGRGGRAPPPGHCGGGRPPARGAGRDLRGAGLAEAGRDGREPAAGRCSDWAARSGCAGSRRPRRRRQHPPPLFLLSPSLLFLPSPSLPPSSPAPGAPLLLRTAVGPQAREQWQRRRRVRPVPAPR